MATWESPCGMPIISYQTPITAGDPMRSGLPPISATGMTGFAGPNSAGLSECAVRRIRDSIPPIRAWPATRAGKTRSSCSNPASPIRPCRAARPIPFRPSAATRCAARAPARPPTPSRTPRGSTSTCSTYFAAHQNKLFVVIAAPPLISGTYAANARAFNNWLVNDWLASYPYQNVAVFDYYTVLTSNGGNANTNDLNCGDRQPSPLPQRRHPAPGGRRQYPGLSHRRRPPLQRRRPEGHRRIRADAQYLLPPLEGCPGSQAIHLFAHDEKVV